MQKKLQKTFFYLEIFASELVGLNTGLYWETIILISCQYANKLSQGFSTTKIAYLRLIFFPSDKKMWQNHFRADLSNLSDLLTCWLSISILRQGFLGI